MYCVLFSGPTMRVMMSPSSEYSDSPEDDRGIDSLFSDSWESFSRISPSSKSMSLSVSSSCDLEK